MDTSKQFIEMCRKAKELQATWQPKDGDFFVYKTFIYTVAGWENGYTVRFGNDPKELERYPNMAEYYDHAFIQFDGGPEYDDRFVAFQKDVVWLPRQDQLQDFWFERLYDKERAKPSALCQEFFFGWMATDAREKFRYNSMEQLLLAFVMEKIFDKTWNDKTWNDKDWIDAQSR